MRSDGRYCINLCGLVVFMVMYICAGAGLFALLEGKAEREIIHTLHNLRFEIAERTSPCISDDELERFIVAIVKGANRGVSAVNNVSLSEPNWSFGQSLFFASTVLTTIGYGRVTPLSDAGKAFCIVYAIIGIPLTLIMLKAIVEQLLKPVGRLLDFMIRQLGHLYKVFHIRLMHLAMVVTAAVILILLIPAAIFTSIEPTWNYLDGFYYTFISMTTIGLGDYIPGDNPNQRYRAVYKVATTGYLLVGLIIMMLWLAVLYEIPELNIGLHFYSRSEVGEDETSRLRTSAGLSPNKYTPQVNESTYHSGNEPRYNTGHEGPYHPGNEGRYNIGNEGTYNAGQDGSYQSRIDENEQ